MVNKNYVKGRKKEYKICEELRARGYDIVQRTAGSHSAVDIIAIRKEDNKILLVQSKPDNFSADKEMGLKMENIWLNDFFNVNFEVR